MKYLLLFLWLLLSLPLYAESYTISEVQVKNLKTNLSNLKDLIANLRVKLYNYEMNLKDINNELEVSQQELKMSQSKLEQSLIELEKANKECETYILKLKKQEQILNEQNQSLTNAKKYSKRLQRKDNFKTIGIIVLTTLAISNHK